MAPGRLLQNSRRRAQPAPDRHVDASDELPPYEPPSQPLNDAARRALAQISNNRSTRKFDDHLKKSTELLRDAVGATNDRMWETNSLVRQRAENARRTGKDMTEADHELQDYAARLGDEVSGVTGKLEAALRDIIDYRVELEDEGVVLDVVRSEVVSQAQAWRPRQPVARNMKKERRRQTGVSIDEGVDEDGNAEEDENEEDSEMREPEDNTPLTGVNDILQKARQAKAEDWTRMDMAQRYAAHNDYIIFKRTLHDAQHPDDGVSLPHPSTWFGADGQPVLANSGETDTPGDDDGDDEVRVAGEVLSFRCPLSMQIMEEPYSNHKCKHTFDKKSILQYIGNQGTVQCPETGCSQPLTIKDFFLDQVLLRKLKRAQQTAAQNEDEDFNMDQAGDGADGHDNEDTVITESSTKVKAEKRGRRTIDDIEDDE